METEADAETETSSLEKLAGPKYRLHFLASFLIFLGGFALATLVAMIASIFILSPGDSLFAEGGWLLLPFVTGTYGIVIAAALGSLFRLLSFYRLTESCFVQGSLLGKHVEITWTQISNVEPVRVFHLFHFPVYRIVHEKSDRPLYFVNLISKREIFDARIIEYTEDSHPFQLLLRKPKPEH